MRQAGHSTRGILPTVVCRGVWSKNLVNEEALAYWGAGVKEKEGNCKDTDNDNTIGMLVTTCRQIRNDFQYRSVGGVIGYGVRFTKETGVPHTSKCSKSYFRHEDQGGQTACAICRSDYIFFSGGF